MQYTPYYMSAKTQYFFSLQSIKAWNVAQLLECLSNMNEAFDRLVVVLLNSILKMYGPGR